jgi:phosphoribosyl 1,2-cyclic phosphodiesterase
MIVRCWGARGSIPVSGPQFERYGGDTTCLELRSRGGGLLIIDAGTGVRRLGNAMLLEGRRDCTLLFTHAHWDHIQGLPFFKPLYSPDLRIRLGLCPARQGDMRRILDQALRPPLFPIPFAEAPARVEPFAWNGGTLEAEGFRITGIALSHPNGGLGYRVEEGGRSLVFLTDNELAHRHRGGAAAAECLEFCRGADALIHDAEYTPEEYPARKGWGHTHALDAARLAREAGVGFFGLFHHNQEREDAAEDALADRCRAFLSDPGDPDCAALTQDWEMVL